jgi:hypothetical protein
MASVRVLPSLAPKDYFEPKGAILNQKFSVTLWCICVVRLRQQKGSKMIEAAKVIVPIGEGKEVEARAIAAELQAFTEPYSEEGLDEVIIEAPDEANLFEERLLVDAIGETPYSEVQVFVPNSLLNSVHANLQELGLPDARQLSETEWTPGATYETRY